MNHPAVILFWCVGLFGGVLLVSGFAYRLGRRKPHLAEASSESAAAVIGALFALLGLLLAFTFSGAYSRFDARRQLIVQEVNAIGTAYLRLDLLPQEAQKSLREAFREYTNSRAAFYEKLSQTRQVVVDELNRTAKLQETIWSKAVKASSGADNQSARMLLIPALNEMIDIVTTRTVAIQTHPPALIFATLALITLACAGMTSCRASASDHPPHFYNAIFAIVMTFTLYLILDIEFPRSGLITLNETNKLFISLLEGMK
jgi:hypothetical protein